MIGRPVHLLPGSGTDTPPKLRLMIMEAKMQDALALAAAIAEGKLSAREAMNAALATALQWHHLGAIAFLDEHPTIAEPAREDRNAPFAGVPSLFKDLGGPCKGLPIRLGSRACANASTELDSEIAVRMRAAGLNFFGTTTVPEFGMALASEPAVGPIARNPLDLGLSPAGSSGGAAAGIVAIAHATDAGGSIRVPAAACGLIGLKPSRGAMPAGPHFGNYLAGIASEFALCRSIRDAAALFPLVSGKAESFLPDPSLAAAETQSCRIGMILDDLPGRSVCDDNRQTVLEAGRLLEKHGHQITTVSAATLAPLLEKSAIGFDRIIAANLAHAVDQYGLDIAQFEPLTQAVARRGKALSATELYAALHDCVLVAHQLWQIFRDIDVLITTMLSKEPLPIGSFPMDHDDVEAHWQRMQDFAPYAALANISGFPALSMPFGTNRNGLPIAVQFIAPMEADTILLQLGHLLEQDQRWQHKFPVAGLS